MTIWEYWHAPLFIRHRERIYMGYQKEVTHLKRTTVASDSDIRRQAIANLTHDMYKIIEDIKEVLTKNAD